MTLKTDLFNFTLNNNKEKIMGFDLYGQSSKEGGDYFRLNVWWWRRLADYVCEHTGVVSEKDKESWQVNDGHFVSKREAEEIAKQLQHLIDTGHAEKYEKKVKREMEVAQTTNEKVEKLFEVIKKRVETATGKKDLVPRDYPKEFKDEWDETYKLRDNRASYPFAVEALKEFIEFCRNSDGFRIS